MFITAVESERPKWRQEMKETEEEERAAKQQIGQAHFFCQRVLGRQSKVVGFIPGQLGALCQWPGCYSPNYKPMNFNTDLEARLLQ